ncbi:translation initiation factor IF-2 subunit gamma, partial [Candidatus Woesearchaeota archaeon]|nr:translation initiation factor IF-2 subunit gamma [Candidatus Woesearchaeota archaeon]
MARKKKDEQQLETLEQELPAQPVLNIGMVGHVDHGKTTLLERLSGKWTDTHSEELKRGITIRLGYADVTFRKCEKCKGANAYTTKEECPVCKSKTIPLRKASFVDAPGHESLMATMLAGATIMDGALLLVAANEECPQPQTREHLMALQIIGIKHVIVVQNKIDLASEEQAIKNYEQIRGFLKGSAFENAPIIPISAQHRVGLNFLMQAIDEH